MKACKLLGLLLIFGFTLPLMSIPVSASITNDTIDLQIVDAYYADLDNDGVQDDIRIIALLNVSEEYLKGNTLRWDFVLKIELPSGDYYVCSAGIVTKASDQYIIFDALNTVTESGWYTAILDARFTNYFHEMESTIFTFDPPEKGGNGTPTLVVSTELI